MKRIKSFFGLAAMFLSMVFLSACATGQGEQTQGGQPACQETFKQNDIGNKGYLTQEDFLGWYQSQGGHHVGQGLAPTGGGSTSFASADTNGDGRLSVKEFCAWVNRP